MTTEAAAVVIRIRQRSVRILPAFYEDLGQLPVPFGRQKRSSVEGDVVAERAWDFDGQRNSSGGTECLIR